MSQPALHVVLERQSVVGYDRNILSEVSLAQEPSKIRLPMGSEFGKQCLKYKNILWQLVL